MQYHTISAADVDESGAFEMMDLIQIVQFVTGSRTQFASAE